MVDSRPQDIAASTKAVPARTARIIMLAFGCAAALIFYQFLRESGSGAPLSMLNNGSDEAGALKLGGYALIATGIQMLILKRSPQLGFYGLLAVSLVMGIVLIAWNLILRMGEGLPFLAPVFAFLIAVWLLRGAWKMRACAAPLSRIEAGTAIIIALPVILILIWSVILNSLLL